jgi:DMSO/TMAO reductase YedYZ molybdopterin-dependent catalytic subunit
MASIAVRQVHVDAGLSHVPWNHDAIGTSEWTGTPLRGVLEEAGLEDDAVEILFTGQDKGIQGGKCSTSSAA